MQIPNGFIQVGADNSSETAVVQEVRDVCYLKCPASDYNTGTFLHWWNLPNPAV